MNIPFVLQNCSFGKYHLLFRKKTLKNFLRKEIISNFAASITHFGEVDKMMMMMRGVI